MGQSVPKSQAPAAPASVEGDDSRRQAAPPRPTVLKPGTVLQSRYRVMDVLGIGGMSTVYRARDLRFAGVERLCAVKEMFNVAEEPRLRQMRLTNFQREAALLATLSHPAIPRIYDYFDVHGTPYLVLELILGQDLETFLSQRGEPYPQDTLVKWGIQLADVLAFLHRQTPEPIIFRDVKPSNIMMKSDELLTLVDFGIARSFAPNQKGTMIGTEGYAPPEQYRGHADVRGDIYAYGATLHHLGTGADPRNETPFTFAQRPPRRFNPSLSAELEQLIMRCTAYSASDRPASMDEIRSTLEAMRDLRPRRVDGVAASQRDRTAGSQTLLRLESIQVIPAAISADGQERLDWQLSTADEVRGSATHGGGVVYFGSYDGNLYAVDESDGSVRWRFKTQRGVVSRPLVAEETVIFGSEDHSIYAVARQQGRLGWTFRTSMSVRSSAVGDERGCTIGSDDGYVYRIDRARGALLWRYRTWGPVRASPVIFKSTISVGSDDGYLYCLERDTGQLRWRRQIGAPIVSSVAVTERCFIFGAADGVVRAVIPENGNVIWSQETGKQVIATPVIVDQVAYVGSADGSMYAFDVASGAVTWKSPITRQITSSATPDGEWLYVGGTDGGLYCLKREDGSVKWRFLAGGPVVAKPLVTPDHVIVGSLDGKVYALHRQV